MSFKAKTPQLTEGGRLRQDDEAAPERASISFDDFVRMGAASTRDAELERGLASATSDDVATLIYTSGTTAIRRAPCSTHANFFHQFRAVDERFDGRAERDRSMCFLPLEPRVRATWSYYVFRRGAENTYLADPKEVVTYMAEVRPTAMVSVPRLYEKICATVQDVPERGPGRGMRLPVGAGVGSQVPVPWKESGPWARCSRCSTGSPTRWCSRRSGGRRGREELLLLRGRARSRRTSRSSSSPPASSSVRAMG